MALEIERKYLAVDHDALRRRLAELGAERVGRWFEANRVFDGPDRGLKARGVLLRLRHKGGQAVLTLKRAAGVQCATAKVYEEHETGVSDAAALEGILEGLGLAPALGYEKVREKWLLHGCQVCLDLLPFGAFAEIEGAEADIAACAEALRLPPDAASTATYHDLNRQHRQRLGLPPDESFRFEPAVREALLRDLSQQ